MVSMITLESSFTRDSTTLMLTKRTIVMYSHAIYISVSLSQTKKNPPFTINQKPQAWTFQLASFH